MLLLPGTTAQKLRPPDPHCQAWGTWCHQPALELVLPQPGAAGAQPAVGASPGLASPWRGARSRDGSFTRSASMPRLLPIPREPFAAPALPLPHSSLPGHPDPAGAHLSADTIPGVFPLHLGSRDERRTHPVPKAPQRNPAERSDGMLGGAQGRPSKVCSGPRHPGTLGRADRSLGPGLRCARPGVTRAAVGRDPRMAGAAAEPSTASTEPSPTIPFYSLPLPPSARDKSPDRRREHPSSPSSATLNRPEPPIAPHLAARHLREEVEGCGSLRPVDFGGPGRGVFLQRLGRRLLLGRRVPRRVDEVELEHLGLQPAGLPAARRPGRAARPAHMALPGLVPRSGHRAGGTGRRASRRGRAGGPGPPHRHLRPLPFKGAAMLFPEPGSPALPPRLPRQAWAASFLP